MRIRNFACCWTVWNQNKFAFLSVDSLMVAETLCERAHMSTIIAINFSSSNWFTRQYLFCLCVMFGAIWYHHCMTWYNFQFCVKAQTKYYKQSSTTNWTNEKKKKRKEERSIISSADVVQYQNYGHVAKEQQRRRSRCMGESCVRVYIVNAMPCKVQTSSNRTEPSETMHKDTTNTQINRSIRGFAII